MDQTADRPANIHFNNDRDRSRHHHDNHQTPRPTPCTPAGTENSSPFTRETADVTANNCFHNPSSSLGTGFYSPTSNESTDFHSPPINAGTLGCTPRLAEDTATILLGQCINENIAARGESEAAANFSAAATRNSGGDSGVVSTAAAAASNGSSGRSSSGKDHRNGNVTLQQQRGESDRHRPKESHNPSAAPSALPVDSVPVFAWGGREEATRMLAGGEGTTTGVAGRGGGTTTVLAAGVEGTATALASGEGATRTCAGVGGNTTTWEEGGTFPLLPESGATEIGNAGWSRMTVAMPTDHDGAFHGEHTGGGIA